MSCLGYHANSADPVQMLQNAVPDQGQHSLPTEISMQYTIKMKNIHRGPLKLEMDSVKMIIKDGQVCWSKIGFSYIGISRYIAIKIFGPFSYPFFFFFFFLSTCIIWLLKVLGTCNIGCRIFH